MISSMIEKPEFLRSDVTQDPLRDTEFLTSLRRDMLRFAEIQLRDKALAEDAVQESFLRLWTSQARDTGQARLATYFNTIVINRCKSWLVRRRELSADPEQLTELSDAQQATHTPVADDLPASSAAQLQPPMARLPARQRMALAMWAYADADVADIARSMELERNAAHQLLHRAKAALRQQLQEHTP